MVNALILAFMPMETGTQAAPGSGIALLNHCRPPENSANPRSFCIGYLLGFVESRELGNLDAAENLADIAKASGLDALKGLDTEKMGRRTFCTPDEVTGEQLRLVVVKWLEDHPARLHESRSILTREALVNAFPCGSRVSSPK